MTYLTDADASRRFAEDYINRLAQYPDGAALILRVADRLRASSMDGAASAHSVAAPQSNAQQHPQASTTDGWNF
jgi:hypothetical protein